MPKKPHDNLIRIVNILNDGQYHDGNSMGQKLKMTRSAVWKTIKKLEKYAIEINSIKGKGYALAGPLILLNQAQIKDNLSHKLTIDVFESINSTNEYLKSLKHIKSPTICIAEHQSQGKSRLNRKWHSPFGKNIYLSCRYPFKKDISELAGLSLVTGLAVLKTLQKYHQDLIYVKWPNDIYYDNKKLAGILHEVFSESHDGFSHAIIGIGLNVNIRHDDDDQIQQPWISMQKILKQYIDRNQLAIELINTLITYLKKFEEKGFSSFIQEWLKHDCLLNKTITLKNIKNKWTGPVKGINDQGQLLLELPNGQLKSFSSGEVSVLKS